MILSCPNCFSQFKVSNDAIGFEGRKVKCSSCAEVWFQEPDPDWLAQKLAEQTEKLEEQLSQDSDMTNLSEVNIDSDSDEIDTEVGTSAFNGGYVKALFVRRVSPFRVYGLAASIVLFYLSYLFINSSAILLDNPKWLGFYGLFGIGFELPEERVIFDQVIAQADGQNILIAGNISNLSNDKIKLYPVVVSLKDQDDTDLMSWVMDVESDYIEPEETIKFETSKDFEKLDGLVDLNFVLQVKTDVKDGDNTQVLH